MAAERRRTTSGAIALVVLVVAALAVYGLDQLSKYLVVTNLVEGEAVQVLGDLLHWQFVRNPGAAFSLASGMTWIFTILAAGVITFIIWFARRIKSVAWGLVFGLLLGGVLGNLTDRLLREPSFGLGHVVDFISTPWLLPAIYNVADMAIVSSMVLFMFLTIRGVGLDGVREHRRSAATTDEQDAEVSETAGPESSGPESGSEPAGGDRTPSTGLRVVRES